MKKIATVLVANLTFQIELSSPWISNFKNDGNALSWSYLLVRVKEEKKILFPELNSNWYSFVKLDENTHF